ncbi:MAG: cysteine desulfurase [Nanoarchaeota archaeon]|nr:cysteine desulfurase [Nanoarchaeota archaeon]
MNVKRIRKDFPFLKRKIIYFDNAATTQKPRVVINAIKDFYENHYANIHRGLHRLSQEASRLYEEAHEKVAKFINAKFEEIIFTKNTTESINLVAYSLDLKKGDEVIVSQMEHHSNIVPWMMRGVKIKYIPVKDGVLEIEKIEDMITRKTKVISCTHVSNFLGTINNVKEIGKIAKEHNILFLIDGAQSAPHMKINVKKLNCDFFAFSSHKMCGPTGVGVLYGRKEILEKIKPFLGGGDMISDVSFKGFKVNKLPWKFEAGTPNIVGAHAFGIAIDYLKKIGMNNIFEHEKKLTNYALKKMEKIKNIEIYGPRKRAGIISFNLKGLNPHDIAMLLDARAKIAIRSGYHCVQPLHNKMGLKGSARVSFYIYNTKKEIDIFIKSLNEIANAL